jgi:hypothetical protein
MNTSTFGTSATRTENPVNKTALLRLDFYPAVCHCQLADHTSLVGEASIADALRLIGVKRAKLYRFTGIERSSSPKHYLRQRSSANLVRQLPNFG